MKTRFRASLALLGLVSMSAILAAQSVPDEGGIPNVGLNLPTTLTTFGKVEPTFRKPTAVVNGDVITGTDVEQRLALIIMSNGGQISAEERDRLRLQILRNLIDESIQIDAAKSNDIKIERSEIEQSFARVASNFKMTPDKLREYLKQNGSSERSIKRQIEGELAWNRLLQRKVNSSINVSDEEVKAVIDRLTAAKGSTEYRVSEIFLSATPENQAEIFENGKKIIEQLRAGGSFAAYARQFSEASTATVGGDLGYIRLGILPPEIDQALQEIQIGQVAGPIQNSGGYSIIYLTDTKKILVADPRDATLNLRQIALNFPAGMSQKDAQARASAFSTATQKMQGCGGADSVAKEFGAELVDNDQIPARNLPPQLQDILLKLQVGQATPPFGSQAEGVRVLVLCGRDEPRDVGAPSAERIEEDLREKKIGRRSQVYLRDLRRDAIVDYR
jgi:peptidyl-prolyl cis-trans isomerase SurA